MTKSRKYELTIIFRLSLKGKRGEGELEKIKKSLIEIGQIDKEENWNKKTLAYPIDKETVGYYYWFLIESEPKKITRLDNILKLDENIIRYLLVAVE